jgi:hypothetical protein
MTYDWAENTSCSATTTAERSLFPTLLPVVPQYRFLGYVLFAPSILKRVYYGICNNHDRAAYN